MGYLACERGSYTCSTRLKGSVGTRKGVPVDMANARSSKNRNSSERQGGAQGKSLNFATRSRILGSFPIGILLTLFSFSSLLASSGGYGHVPLTAEVCPPPSSATSARRSRGAVSCSVSLWDGPNFRSFAMTSCADSLLTSGNINVQVIDFKPGYLICWT